MAEFNPETLQVELTLEDRKKLQATFNDPEDYDGVTKERLEKYLSDVCTSGCGNDFDCPHEEMFFEAINDEIMERRLPGEAVNVLTEKL